MRQHMYPYGTPAAFSGRGFGQASNPKIPVIDVDKLPDPRTGEVNAAKFTAGIVAGIAASERALDRIFDQLAYQASLGIVDCDEVTHYNQMRLANYEAQAWLLIEFSDIWAEMRDQGVYVPREPTPPKLIASDVRASRLPNGSRRYDFTTPCVGESGKLLDIGALKYLGPVCIAPEQEGVLGNPVVAACSTPWTALGCAILIGGAYLLLSKTADLWNTITDKDIDIMKAQADERRYQRDLKRLDVFTQCVQRDLVDFQWRENRAPEAAEKEAIRAKCKGVADKAVPDREPPDFSRWGRVGWLLALAGGIGFVIYMWGRRPAKSAPTVAGATTPPALGAGE
jgi:hypothetical protein